VAVLVGGAVTLGADYIWLDNWMQTGLRFPVGQQASVRLPRGQTLVYYESPLRAPVGDVTLTLLDEDGERVRTPAAPGDVSYSLLYTGWTGRALWLLDLPATATYTFKVNNYNFADDREIPSEDRVVFLREPNAFEEVRVVHVFVLVTGATITMTLVIVLYVLHHRALSRRAAPA